MGDTAPAEEDPLIYRSMLEVPAARSHGTGLLPELLQTAGKLSTSSPMDQPLEVEPREVHIPERFVYTSSVSPTSGFRLSGVVNGISISLLVDTGAAVTLLRLDTWEQVAAKDPVALELWPAVRLLSAGGVPLTVHGCARITLGLGAESFQVEVVVASPLTLQAILGLNFLLQQQATINLASKTLHLAEKGCNIPLQDPAALTDTAVELPVCCAVTVEVPPRSSMQIVGTIPRPVGELWLLEEATTRRLPVAVAQGLVEPPSPTIPLVVLNPSEEPVMVYSGARVTTLQNVKVPATKEVGAVNTEVTEEVGQEKREMLWDLVENSSAQLSPGEKDLFYHFMLM